MKAGNRAFGLLCGYDGGTAKCYRINRAEDQTRTTIVPEVLSKVQPLGCEIYANEAADHARRMIVAGKDGLTALKDAIQVLLDRNLECVESPVRTAVVHP